jgi:hypothetical protein
MAALVLLPMAVIALTVTSVRLTRRMLREAAYPEITPSIIARLDEVRRTPSLNSELGYVSDRPVDDEKRGGAALFYWTRYLVAPSVLESTPRPVAGSGAKDSAQAVGVFVDANAPALPAGFAVEHDYGDGVYLLRSVQP